MRFEQLDVWKRACRLSCDVYKELKNCRDYGLRDQMTRAAVSIPSNIAEGKNVNQPLNLQGFFILQKAHQAN